MICDPEIVTQFIQFEGDFHIEVKNQFLEKKCGCIQHNPPFSTPFHLFPEICSRGKSILYITSFNLLKYFSDESVIVLEASNLVYL